MTTTTNATTITTFGALQGAVDDRTLVFRGIPFARPPLADLRFAPPRPPEPWNGLRDATTFGPAAMQPANPVSGREALAGTNEDCLYLNVWTPAIDEGRRPVMVWLHGGAFTFGAGSAPMFRGAALAQRGDVVVVTVNYRLGIFGYLRGIDLCGDALPSTGNEGLLDQLAALQWVKNEIAAFGGDPNNMTVFGQSAGALSIFAMLAMPQARRLFHKAIQQSPPDPTNFLHTPTTANHVTQRILKGIDLRARDARRLREMPAGELLDIQARVTPRSSGGSYRPVVDGTEIPRDPLAAIAGGSAAGVPLLVGTNLDEHKRFWRLDPDLDQLTEEGLQALLADPHTTARYSLSEGGSFDPTEAAAVYQQARAARGESTRPRELWSAIMTDRRFRVPTTRLAEHHAAHTPQTYAYTFTWRSPAEGGRHGAAHGFEVPFVFGTLDAPEAREFVPDGAPVCQLSQQMQDAWLAFARSGCPRTASLPDWSPYSVPQRCTMELGLTSAAVDAPYEAERRFWDRSVTN